MRNRLALPFCIALGLAGLTSCGDANNDGSAALPATDQPSESSSSQAPQQAVDDTASVNVYWGWSIDTVAAGSLERLGAGARLAAGPEGAVEALLDGPSELETEIGMLTAIPAATELLDVSISDGVATVDLTSDFNEGGGTLGEAMRFGQVVFTLTQFETIDAVGFRIDGVDVTEIGTHGFDVSEPIDRNAFNGDVRPFILVEHPTPGQTFSVGDRLQGESDTFEGTVEYIVADGEGQVIGQGFTTAGGGNGTWGRFDVVVEYEPTAHTLGSIIVFESSPRDGTQQNIVEYPATLDAATPTTTIPTTTIPTTVAPEIPATR